MGAATPPLTRSMLADFTANSKYRAQVYDKLKTQVPGCGATADQLLGKAATGLNSTCIDGAYPNRCPAGTGIVPPPGGDNQYACMQKSVLVASDLMWGNSYIASCRYLNSAAEKAVKKGGSCAKLSNGFIYLTASHGLIATCYIFIIMITCWARKAWDSEFYEENLPNKDGAIGDDYSPGVGMPMEQQQQQQQQQTVVVVTGGDGADP